MRRVPTTLMSLLLAVAAACGGNASPPEVGTMDPIPIPAEIIVLGDFGSGTEGQYEVAGTMRQTVVGIDVELFLTVGDNFYNDDVERVWADPYGWVSADGIEIAAAWGNHDVETETRTSLVQSALNPPGNYYTAELGDGKLIILDSNSVRSEEQTQWLRDQLQSAGSPVIVAFHHPPYSCGTYSADVEVRDQWAEILEDHDVDLVLSGHDHNYQRFRVGETTYVIAGGGGRSLTDVTECPADNPDLLASNDAAHHFVMLEITSAAISAEAIAVDGSTIDSFEIDY